MHVWLVIGGGFHPTSSGNILLSWRLIMKYFRVIYIYNIKLLQYMQPGEEWSDMRGSWVAPGVCLVVVVVVSTGYKEEGMLAASFSVGWTVPLQGKVLSVSDCCPAAVSVAAAVAVTWLLSLPLTWAWYDNYYSCHSPVHTACDRVQPLKSLGI